MSNFRFKAFAAVLAIAAFSMGSNVTEAAITVSGFERFSSSTTAANGDIKIFGGMAGDTDRCDVLNSSQTCNNCLLKSTETLPLGTPDNLLLPCNERRINPNLEFVINISSDAIDGTPTITDSDGNVAVAMVSNIASVAKGTVTTVVVRWSEICKSIIANDTSSGGESATPCRPVNGIAAGILRVGISGDGDALLDQSTDDIKRINFVISTGLDNPAPTTPSLAEKCSDAGADPQICYFEVGPGDEKVVVKTLLAPDNSGFPIVTNTRAAAVRFLFEKTGFNHITLASGHVDLPISAADSNNFNVSPKRIEGLQNDQTYYFKNALVDEAGNVSHYSSADNDDDCVNAVNPLNGDCRIATPSEVVGVLDKTNCFIATAAYGTPFAGELDTLRDFRDQVLESSSTGHAFVRWYYANSPKYAEMILANPYARATVRAGLIPVVWFAGMALAYGPLKASLAFLVSLIAIAALISLGRRPDVRAAAHDGYVDMKNRAKRSLLPMLIGALLLPTLEINRAHAQSSIEPLEESIEQALDETPPPAEYPYPGAAGSVTAKPKPQQPVAPEPNPFEDVEPVGPSTSVIAKEPEPSFTPEATFEPEYVAPAPVRKRPRPKYITEEGDYIYEKTPDTPPRQYGEPKAKKFSNRPGREKPVTISADGTFDYPVESSPFVGAAGIRFGMMTPPNFKNASNGLTFKEIYGSAEVPAILLEYEYPLTRAIGRIGLKFETGVYTTQAGGRFKNPARAGEVPDERFTFIMIPLQAMLHYRFQFADSQLFVPFVEGGASYNGIVELRDDNKSPRMGGAPSAIAGGGVNILLDWIDRRSIRQLDADYGINHVWFTAQYRQIVGLKSDLDLSSSLISGGFTFDF